MIIETRTCICYTSCYGSKEAEISRPGPLDRVADDLLEVHGAIPESRCLSRLPQGPLPSQRERVPRLRQGDEVPPDQEPRRVQLPILRASGLSHGRHDLPQVHGELADVVLG